jgi:hypothetical protein
LKQKKKIKCCLTIICYLKKYTIEFKNQEYKLLNGLFIGVIVLLSK